MLSVRRTKQMGNILWDMHFGQIVLNKPLIVINLINLLIVASIKWDFNPVYYIIPIGILGLYLLWLVGHLLNKAGIRQAFTEANFEDVKLK